MKYNFRSRVPFFFCPFNHKREMEFEMDFPSFSGFVFSSTLDKRQLFVRGRFDLVPEITTWDPHESSRC